MAVSIDGAYTVYKKSIQDQRAAISSKLSSLEQTNDESVLKTLEEVAEALAAVAYEHFSEVLVGLENEKNWSECNGDEKGKIFWFACKADIIVSPLYRLANNVSEFEQTCVGDHIKYLAEETKNVLESVDGFLRSAKSNMKTDSGIQKTYKNASADKIEEVIDNRVSTIADQILKLKVVLAGENDKAPSTNVLEGLKDYFPSQDSGTTASSN